MSDGALHSLALVPESSYGTTPATPPFETLRITSCGLALTKDIFESEEIRSDRQRSDVRHGARKVGGDLGIELSYGSHDTMLEALMCGTWTTKGTITAATISAAASDNSFNDSGNGFVAAGFEVGDSVTVTGFTHETANNIAKGKITALTVGKMTIGGTDGDVIVDEGASEAVTISTRDKVLKVGTTRRSFTLERKFGDLLEAAYPYHRFTGCEFNTLDLSINANAMVTGTIGVVGKDLTLAGTAIAGASYAAASTTSPLDSFTGSLKEAGSTIAIVTELSLKLDNGLAPKFIVGSSTTLEPSIGRAKVTGQIGVYFIDAVMLNKFINETASYLELHLPDAAGNDLEIYIPRIKYTGGQPDVKGEGPIMLSMPFEALYDSTTVTNLRLTRSPV